MRGGRKEYLSGEGRAPSVAALEVDPGVWLQVERRLPDLVAARKRLNQPRRPRDKVEQ